MTVSWDFSNCENWDKLDGKTSAEELSAAMWGYDNFNPRVVITEDNFRAIALYIYNKCPYTNFRTGEKASLRMHFNMLKNAIGFVRRYHG